MHGWYVLDEFQGGVGSPSGEFRWPAMRTTWPRNSMKPGENLSVAMPHGWAVAELWLLMRDCLVFEDQETLVLLAGVPPAWFRSPSGIECAGLATHFGDCGFRFKPLTSRQASLTFAGSARPPRGFRLRLPAGFTVDGTQRSASGDWLLPPEAKEAYIQYD
jgi:hypothetical protein